MRRAIVDGAPKAEGEKPKKGMAGLGPAPARPSPAVLAARRELVAKLIYSGSTLDQIVRLGTRQGYDEEALRRDHFKILDEWKRDHDQSVETARVEAVHRLKRDLFELRNPGQLRNRNGYPVFETVRDAAGKAKKVNGKTLKRPVMAPVDYAVVRQHEELLSKILGTQRPAEIKVDVEVRERRAAIAILARLTPDDEDRLLAENLGRDVLVELASRPGLPEHRGREESEDANGDRGEADDGGGAEG